MAAMSLLCLIVAASVASTVVLGVTKQQKFKIRKIVESRWTATELSEQGEYNTVMMCSQYCLLKDGICSAFRLNEATEKCEIGHLPGNALLDSGGIEVFVKPENATIYPHIMLIEWNGNFVDINLKDLTMEYPTFLSLGTAGLATPSWGWWYKNGFFLCSHAADITCKHYSMTTGTWTDRGTLPQPHYHEPGTVAILDEIWFISGGSGTKKVSYIKDWTWHEAPDYPLTVYHMATSPMSKTEFMVCGGYTYLHVYHDECYKMDAIKKDAWVQLASMPMGRIHFEMAMYADPTTGKTKVIVPTGHNLHVAWDLNQVDIYDVETDAWTTVGNFPFGVHRAGVFSYNNVVWHVGGLIGTVGSRKVHVYNAEDDTWTDTGVDLPSDVRDVHSVLYNDGRI